MAGTGPRQPVEPVKLACAFVSCHECLAGAAAHVGLEEIYM